MNIVDLKFVPQGTPDLNILAFTTPQAKASRAGKEHKKQKAT